MKKEKLPKLLFFISIILIIIFIISIIYDYSNYQLSSSAPFYIFILVRAVEFLFPSLVLIIIGLFLKKKSFPNIENKKI